MKITENDSVALNREIPDSLADGWIHLAPIGEFRARRQNGKTFVQVIDEAGVAEMAAHLDKKLLVDREHWSMEESGNTEAAGWIVELKARPDGLWGRIEWTDIGQQLIANKRYRFISPIVHLDNPDQPTARAIRLLGAGLTNKPNLSGMVPLANKETKESSFIAGHKDGFVTIDGHVVFVGPENDTTDEDSSWTPASHQRKTMEYEAVRQFKGSADKVNKDRHDAAYNELLKSHVLQQRAAARAAGFKSVSEWFNSRSWSKHKAEEAEKRKDESMKQFATALGLAEDADETACLTALNKLKDDAAAGAQAKTRLDELEAAALAGRADQFIAKHTAVIGNKDEVRAKYIADEQGTIALFGAIKVPEPATTALHRADGKPPATDPAAQQAAHRRVERDQFVDSVRTELHLSKRAEAWPIAQRRKPELFA